MGKLFGAVKQAAKDFLDDECMGSGAAIAFYTIFALPPLLMMAFFVAGMFGVSPQKIDEVVTTQLGLPAPRMTGQQGQDSQPPSPGQNSPQSPQQAGGLEAVASRAESQQSPLSGLGPISRIVGILVLVASATGILAQLQHALNRAWGVEPDPGQSGIWSFLCKRALSLGMIAVLAFLLLVSLVLTTLVDELVRLVTGGSSVVWATAIGIALNSLVTLAIATLLFAAMFKLMPDARMRWTDTWVGAFITALLFVIGKSLLAWYRQNSEIGSTWGSAAASMIAMLVWVYYSSLIALFGAELAQVWATLYGHGIEPAQGAVRIVEENRRRRGSAA
jgi:membrane protein